ncbi:MAG: hypothetical protein LBI82_11100 [Dysgonamonadaceae bacterium]|jgi:hypothetical protein|nr:hypothetical protein [Dysgonamonadaceae bacterium]
MKQNYQRIEEQIERFFDGQTSNEEERELYAFFSSENVPEHLLPYRPVFAYFKTGIKEDSQPLEIVTIQSSRKKKIRIWMSIAASLLILISFGIYHFTQEKDFNPYEGSYIIRNGVKITDPKIVNPEIEKTLYAMLQREKEYDQLLQKLQEIEQDPYERAITEIKQQQLKWVETLQDETIREEVLKIINLEL